MNKSKLHPITNEIKQNIKKNAIKTISTAAVAAAGAVITYAGSNFIRTIKVTSDSYPQYCTINNMLYDISPKICKKYASPLFMRGKPLLGDDHTFYIQYNKYTYIKVTTSNNGYKNNERLIHIITLSIIGKSATYLYDKFIKESSNMSIPNNIYVYDNINYDTYQIPEHSFDNMILDADVKNKLIYGLKSWSNNKNWYDKHQLVHKIGILLYGDPGTGKSTIVKSISNLFNNAPIITISNIGSIDNSRINTMRATQTGEIIVLFEDIDLLLPSDDNSDVDGGYVRRNKTNSLQSVLQVLDGVYSTNDTIYIATTNCKDKLDAALIRKGRFDIQIELKSFNKNQAIEFVEKLGYNKSILKKIKITYPIQPAELQSKILEYKSHELIEEGIANAGETNINNN